MSYWLPENRNLKLTVMECGWLWAILIGLDKERGENWPTAKPDDNGNPIPTTVPRRIAEKIAAIVDQEEL